MELTQEAQKVIGGIVQEQLKGFKPALDPATATKEEFEAVNKMIVKANEDITAQKQLIEKLSSQNDSLQAKLNTQVNAVKKTFSLNEALWDAVAEKKEEIEAILKSGGRQTKPLEFNVGTKAAVDLTTDNTIGAGSTQYLLTQNTGIISRIRHREERYLSVAAPGAIGSQRALWVEETDEQGVPVFIAEGSAKTQVSVKYVERTAEVRKIVVFSKVTTEMLADLPQLISFIQNSMTKRLSLATETQLISGDGVGENLYGLTYFATAFDAGTLTASITSANELDVLRAISLQVELGFGNANALFIHPADWAKIQLIKDLDGKPLWKTYEVAGTGDVVINGMKIVSTTAISAGSFAGGDMTVANVLYRQGLTVQIGLDGNDFTNNKKTILVEQRLVQFVSANDTPVLVKGDWTSAKAALNAAS